MFALENFAKRILWLDSIRGFAFLFVIYHHLSWKNLTVTHLYMPFFLSIFFFVSGYLYKENHSFIYVFKERTRTLLVPFLILGSCMIAMSMLLSFKEPVPLLVHIKGFLFQYKNGGENHAILWFIAALYVYSVLFYFVMKFSKTKIRLFVVSLILFVLNWVYSYVFEFPILPWYINSAGFALFYMGLGNIYKHNESLIDKNYLKLLLPLGIVNVAYILVFNSCNFAGSKFLVDSLFLTMSSITILVVLSKKYFSKSKLLLFIGSNSLFYFAFHGKCFTVLEHIEMKFLFSQFEHNAAVDLLVCIVNVILTALLLIVPAILINKYVPFAVGKRNKK